MSNDIAGKTESILDIVKGIDEKTIMLPEFQRDFRWELNQTCDLFDSLIQDIFIGAIIYGRPSFAISLREIDSRPRKVKGKRHPLEIYSYSNDDIKYKRDVEHLRIVLDGQQRITSIYRAVKEKIDDIYLVLKSDLNEKEIPRPVDISLEEIYSHIDVEDNKQAISVLLSDVYDYEVYSLEDEDLNQKFNDSYYGNSLQIDGDELAIQKGQKLYRIAVKKMRDIFKESKMVSYYLLDMELNKFCTFFERSNSRGIQLNFTDILAAKLYQGFNLRKEVENFETQNPTIKVNREILIRALAYITCIEKHIPTSIEKDFILGKLEHQDFTNYWQKVCGLYVEAIQYLKKIYWIVSQDWMPSENMSIPLMIFLRQIKSFDSMNEDQKKFLEYWYWASTFSNRYSTSSNEVILTDCKVLTQIAKGERIENYNYFVKLRSLITEPEDLFSYGKKSSAIYKGVHNLINYLAHGTVNWTNTQTTTGKAEDHHIYPRAYIASRPVLDIDNDEAEQLMDSVVNRTLIAEGLNVKIGKKPPHIYLAEIKEINPQLEECLEKHYIPKNIISETSWSKSFKKFLDERSESIFKLIHKYAVQPMEEMNKKFGTPSSHPLRNLKDLINAGKVNVNDLVYVSKNPDQTARILDDKNVDYEGQAISINDWVKQILGVKKVNIYSNIYLKKDNCSLDSLRQK